ncbi:zinc-binding alcohol dehydrogenase [Nesterenkonia sp. HG001]|uniref:zinc-dependent alcohol dehydrogenase n=1 Tax=Nesterenkonia sp. HG001 TaxID=2983207 RepID=UPI002AC6BDDD|nr:zinc-binding alcohol dehydrogenase [Nesterenkonia sp. HG001]MDZ5076180.1 zinc-binding alcohol dehydrogenase [Nesterenkonia sp. HG001]
MEAPSSRQFWTVGPGRGELRQASPPRPADGEVLVETIVSGISRGTESMVHRGDVPPETAELMRAPHQLGELPHPVSHGYLNVGVVRDGQGEGAAELVGRTVFSLAGHREHVAVPAEDCHPLPPGCPPERALLAGAAETGLNALWEAGVSLGDRVTVIGGGMIGLATALLADRMPLERLEVVEVDAARRQLIDSLGLHALPPGRASTDRDVVLHSSATGAGLAEALRVAGDDTVIVEQSWYGQHHPDVPLGADFHARRLRIVASQVGEVAQPRRLRRTRRQRLQLALSLLDERFDALLTGRSPLEDLPEVMDALAAEDPTWSGTICHVVDHRTDQLSPVRFKPETAEPPHRQEHP